MSVSHVSLCFPVTGKRSGAVCVYVSPPEGETLHTPPGWTRSIRVACFPAVGNALVDQREE